MIRVNAFLVFLAVTSAAQADTTIRDVSNVLGQVNRMFGGSASVNTQKTQYVASGTRVRLDDGRAAAVYGFECAPREQRPCGSIKVDGGSHRITVVPVGGQPFEERWTFRRLGQGELVFVRPSGRFVVAANG
jgi:hypothetical protein